MTAATTVRKTVTVRASAPDAFRMFTAEFDRWWPREHHIGQSPMRRAVIEGRAGGRCYTEQEDGTDCPWGTVTTWEPPARLVLAWQISPAWRFEPDLAKSSEVEITFTEIAPGQTRVDLEHRHFERMGPGGDSMRQGVDAPGGWGSLLELYAAVVAR
jgi:uncharacterized protein YndB with AHSA1/START domain